ncbi:MULTISPECIES: hypothetical protein [unclassified Bradyrhizobium]|uniref:hypothetical protein n=1 Tax=unclassified Bradyrhizobium TaxID=2631580 RepID=UPI001FE1F15D|nr:MULTISPECIES: hypothetical protein [unclassified Bradyrhizobium]MDI4236758.1 hypothetical protein [Bradyrhizobium sp. Arg237L]
MNELDERIEQLERRAAESTLIADLSPRREIRIHNTRLADELRQVAAELKMLQSERPWAA